MRLLPLFMLILLLGSCARQKEVTLSDKKAKCLEEKSGTDCYLVGHVLANSMYRGETNRSQNGIRNSVVHYLKLGCDYKSAESCYELGSYLASIGHKRANFYLEKSCKLKRMDHCN